MFETNHLPEAFFVLACVVYEMETFNETIAIILEYFSVFTIFLVLFLVLFIYTICAELSNATYFNRNDTEQRNRGDTMI